MLLTLLADRRTRNYHGFQGSCQQRRIVLVGCQLQRLLTGSSRSPLTDCVSFPIYPDLLDLCQLYHRHNGLSTKPHPPPATERRPRLHKATQLLPQAREEVEFDPALQGAMNRAIITKFLRQMIPLTSGTQTINDVTEDLALTRYAGVRLAWRVMFQ